MLWPIKQLNPKLERKPETDIALVAHLWSKCTPTLLAGKQAPIWSNLQSGTQISSRYNLNQYTLRQKHGESPVLTQSLKKNKNCRGNQRAAPTAVGNVHGQQSLAAPHPATAAQTQLQKSPGWFTCSLVQALQSIRSRWAETPMTPMSHHISLTQCCDSSHLLIPLQFCPCTYIQLEQLCTTEPMTGVIRRENNCSSQITNQITAHLKMQPRRASHTPKQIHTFS